MKTAVHRPTGHKSARSEAHAVLRFTDPVVVGFSEAMVLSVSSAVGDTASSKLSVAPTGVELHSSRYSIPRTLPYFANFKSQTVSYKQYCDVEGDYRKQRLNRQVI